MSAILAKLRPLGAQDFQNKIGASKGKDAESLVERRAAGLRKEVTQQLDDQSPIPLRDRLSLATVQVESFVEAATRAAPSLKTRVCEIGTELRQFIQTKTTAVEVREAAAAEKRADSAFKQFQSDVMAKGKEIRKAFRDALSEPNANVIEVLGAAKARLAEIQLIKHPLHTEEVADFVEQRVAALDQDLKSLAFKAQVKKTEQAFERFVKSHAKPIQKDQQYLKETHQRWSQFKGVASAVMHELAAAEFAIPNTEVYGAGHLRDERNAMIEEVQNLRLLLNLEPSQASSLEEMIPEGVDQADLVVRAKQATVLLEEAVKTRRFAGILTGAKTAATNFPAVQKALEDSLFQASRTIGEIRERMGDNYDPAKIGELEGFLKTAKEQHVAIREELATLQTFPEVLHKALPNVEFGHITFRVRQDLGSQEESMKLFETRLAQYKAVEASFENGDFEHINVEHFTHASNALFNRLKEIIEQKLKPLTEGGTEEEIAAAKQYKQAVNLFMKRASADIVKQLALDILKPTFIERLLNFFAWIASLFASIGKKADPEPVAMEPARADARPAPAAAVEVDDEPLPAQADVGALLESFYGIQPGSSDDDADPFAEEEAPVASTNPFAGAAVASGNPFEDPAVPLPDKDADSYWNRMMPLSVGRAPASEAYQRMVDVS